MKWIAPYLVEAEPADLAEAVKGAERRCGYSWLELSRIAATGDFPTVSARLSWLTVKDLGYYAMSNWEHDG